MSSSAIRDFLHDEIFDIGNTITYRILSRRMNVHVNVAKNELAQFFNEDREALSATFLVSGLTLYSSSSLNGPDVMDVDGTSESDIKTEKILLVSHEALEESRAEFIEIRACHIYSVSSKPQTTRTLSATMEQVQMIDALLDTASARNLGKVIGNDVNISLPAPTKSAKASSSKPTVVAKPSTSSEEKKGPEVEKKPTTLERRVNGTLDWSKAKGKKKDEGKADVKMEVKEEKRGTKRKSEVVSKAKAEVKEEGSLRVKKGVVLSDDEDKIRPTKGRGDESERESVRALMDIDDSEVEKATRPTPNVARPSPEKYEEIETNEKADSEVVPKAKGKKRAPKKSVPVGRNGYPKQKVKKTRSSVDAKGYMVFEDYSEYESVDEEEGAAAKKETEEARKKKTDFSRKKTPEKARTTQKSLTSFFK